MKKFLQSLALLAIMNIAVSAVFSQEKREYKAPPLPDWPSAPVKAGEKLLVPYGYVSPKGTFDLKDAASSVFHYQDEAQKFRAAKWEKYAEDSNFLYYRETSFPTFWWAFAKIPHNGAYAIWHRPGGGGFVHWSDGQRLPRVGD